MRNRLAMVAVLLVGCSMARAVTPCCGRRAVKAAAPAADAYGEALQNALTNCYGRVASWTPGAEQAAANLVAGGALYVGGSMPGFDIEALNRAGGLCLVQRLLPQTQTKSGDVVFYAVLAHGAPTDGEQVAKLRQSGALVVVFGHAGTPAANAATTVVEPGFELRSDGLPRDGVMNVANLWAFSAEMIGAMTRQGKMPTMFQSVAMPGARERNADVRQQPFHTDRTVKPVPRYRLGRLYLARQQRHLLWLRRPAGLEALARAATLAAEAKRQHKTLWVWLYGHYPPYVAGTPGDPGLWKSFTGAVSPDTVAKQVHAGDVFCHIGYVSIESAIFGAAKTAGAKTIAAVAGTRTAAPADHQVPDVWIDPHWVLGDADIEVYGYDVPILPPSGFVQVAIYWMLTAETLARM